MDENFLQKLDLHMNELGGLYGGSCDIWKIEEAQAVLKLKFQPSYIFFLTKYGGGIVGSYYIYGLKKISLMDENCWSVVEKTKFYKEGQGWPGIEDWYVISDDGAGNPIGCKPDGSVWLSDHDAGFEQVKLADSFEEFLEKILNDTLYE